MSNAILFFKVLVQPIGSHRIPDKLAVDQGDGSPFDSKLIPQSQISFFSTNLISISFGTRI